MREEEGGGVLSQVMLLLAVGGGVCGGVVGGTLTGHMGGGGRLLPEVTLLLATTKLCVWRGSGLGGGAGTGYFQKLHCYWQQQKVCVVGGERSGGVLPGVTWLLETPEEGQIRAFTHYIRIFIVVNTHLHTPFKTSKCVCLQNLQV